MSSSKTFLLFLIILVYGSVQTQDLNCKDVKKKGYKVQCPTWNDPQCGQECEWYEMASCDDLDKGTCGAGMMTESRARTCKYFDEEKNRNLECQEVQDKKSKCRLQCGAFGSYNELLDFCECTENFDGRCCDKKIDACTNPVIKKGEIDRSIAHVGRGNRCDARLRPSWYKFDSPAGNEMPTECVPAGSCNTVVPFWLNGTHPRLQDGVVERLACGTQGDNCCQHKLKIKVRKCKDYMAYYLVPTQGCMKSYCIGSHEKCPEGESSDSGFQPGCSREFPDVKVIPTVSYYVNDKDKNNQVSLTCSAVYPDAGKYLWKVQWFFDGEPGPIEAQKRPTNNPQPKFYLPSTAWASKMGTQAQCTMQAKFANGVGTWSQGHVFSPEYYLGILIEEKVVNVKEGETAQVTLRPNLPVRCHQTDEGLDACHLVMAISMDPTAKGPRCPGKPAEISQVIFEGDMEMKCGYKDIKHTNWHKANPLKIKPKLDIQLDGVQSRTLRLRVHEEGTSIPDFWRGYILPTVQINILDSDDRGTCSMVNDPHITTFDGRLYDFHDRPNRQGNNQIFVVYKHTKESEEVQARFTHCGSNIYCICGVSMRAGSSTVVFDRCRTSPNLHPELNYNIKDGVMHPGMRVFKHNSGTQYHVFLPTGTQVKVYAAGGNLIWFEVKASVETKNKIVGLCGNYNGDPKDDIRNSQGDVKCPHYNTWFRCEDESFRTSWHVPEKDSIFAGKVPPHNPGEHMEELFCDCISEPGHHGYEDCNYHKRYEPCDEGFELFKLNNGYSREEYPWLETYKAPQQINPAFIKAAASVEDHFYSAWSAEAFTEQKAKEFCKNELFSSAAVTSCLNEVPNQDYTSSIEACALDLVLTGSTEYAATHLESVKSKCNQELRMNLELWEPRENDDETPGETPAVVGPPLRLMENLCPNECSDNGACIDGKCTCKKGYSSYDCSLKVDEIPVIKGVASSSVPCDRSSQDCTVIALEGMKYLEGPSLTCHYYNDDGSDGKYFYSGPSHATPVTTAAGNLFSLWVVQCQVPQELSNPSSGRTTFSKLQVAVSNDGLKQSDRAFYGSYDARCEKCVDKTCTRKDDSCIISSQCYGFGELNPGNNDEACNPGLSGFSWSPKSSLTSPTPGPTTTPVEITTPPEITTTPGTTTTGSDGGDIVCNLKPNEQSFHRDPKNCNKYYVCEGTRKHHMDCPLGLAFSEKLKLCVSPNEVPGCS